MITFIGFVGLMLMAFLAGMLAWEKSDKFFAVWYYLREQRLKYFPNWCDRWNELREIFVEQRLHISNLEFSVEWYKQKIESELTTNQHLQNRLAGVDEALRKLEEERTSWQNTIVRIGEKLWRQETENVKLTDINRKQEELLKNFRTKRKS